MQVQQLLLSSDDEEESCFPFTKYLVFKMWESYCTEDLSDTFPFMWCSFTYRSLNYNEMLTELNLDVLNICQNTADNIMQVESVLPKMENKTKPTTKHKTKQTKNHNPNQKGSFLYREGMQRQRMSE